MEKRKSVCLCILAAVVLAALVISIYPERPILLADKYPSIATGTYQATMEWDGQTSDESIEAKISDEEFRTILSSASVKKHKASNQMPSVAFTIHLTDGTKGYSIVVGGDHTISVAQTDSLQQTRTFWLDCEARVFDDLYACHVSNGGTTIAQVESSLPEAYQQKLRISSTPQPGAYVSLPLKDLDETDGTMIYDALSDVKILLDGSEFPLEEAIRDCRVSIPELISWARLDARNGYCRESTQTHNGLTQFLYHYSSFNLLTIYDVLDTPDGRQHLIQSLRIAPPDSSFTVGSTVFTDAEGNILDREDWGLTLEVQDAAPTGITLRFTQTGGQQIGQLKAIHYSLDSVSEETHLVSGVCEAELAENDTSLCTLDWSDLCGELPTGEYYISIEVYDFFDESQVHPLMQDFHRSQYYGVSFEIP